MNNKTNSTLQPEPDAAKPEQVDETRRRLGKVGVAGSGVILTLASRSVLGDWGTCTGSEMMSGNLSRPGEANPCGCSPGRWGNGVGSQQWVDLIPSMIPTAYAPGSNFNTVFGVTFYSEAVTLAEAVKQEKHNKITVTCGNKKAIAMHAVAALLNASVYGDRYPSTYNTSTKVIDAFQLAFGFSEDGRCDRLNTFKDAVAVENDYDDAWCFGERNT